MASNRLQEQCWRKKDNHCNKNAYKFVTLREPSMNSTHAFHSVILNDKNKKYHELIV
ncbi:hypothetical protein B7P43_G13945 [Cryptotermes secundus]|uniref:Uncharacterized protein n=1 Tax=Cryptotermes secundus TaxID=105785 RepID=A0A2J7R0P8_9NEOP|nr:hypothetical protein B7P43_G13945 [Cryptotermes secundus]